MRITLKGKVGSIDIDLTQEISEEDIKNLISIAMEQAVEVQKELQKEFQKFRKNTYEYDQ